jgi:hypothetical protein
MRVSVFTYDGKLTNSEVIDDITSIHETQNSLILINQTKATRVFDKQDIDKVILSSLR